MTTVAQRLQGALKQVAGGAASDSAKKTAEVDDALGGGGGNDRAPAFVKTIGAHIARVPGMFGKSHIAEVLGLGEVPETGEIGPRVHISTNLRDKKSHTHVSAELKEEVLTLKKDLHNADIQRQILVFKRKEPIAITDVPYFKHVCVPKLKAFSLTDFSAWVPQLNLQFFFEEFELLPGLDQFFPVVPMPSRTVLVPGALTRLKGKLEADTSTFTAQYNTSSSYTMTAQDCVVHTDITEDLMQDIVPQAGGFERLRKEAALGIGRSKDDALLNGDDTISSSVQGDGHMDSDIAGGAATLFNKAFKGLRKRGLAASLVYDNGGNGVSLATYNGTLALLGKFLTEKADLLIIIGPTIGNKTILGNVPELLTHDKAGPTVATLLTGNLPKVYGIDQYVSEWVREDVNNVGVYASAQALTTLTVVKKSRFAIGTRAPMRMWAAPSLPSSDKMLLSCKERFTFGGIPQTSTEKSVAIGYNIALT